MVVTYDHMIIIYLSTALYRAGHVTGTVFADIAIKKFAVQSNIKARHSA